MELNNQMDDLGKNWEVYTCVNPVTKTTVYEIKNVMARSSGRSHAVGKKMKELEDRGKCPAEG